MPQPLRWGCLRRKVGGAACFKKLESRAHLGLPGISLQLQQQTKAAATANGSAHSIHKTRFKSSSGSSNSNSSSSGWKMLAQRRRLINPPVGKESNKPIFKKQLHRRTLYFGRALPSCTYTYTYRRARTLKFISSLSQQQNRNFLILREAFQQVSKEIYLTYNSQACKRDANRRTGRARVSNIFCLHAIVVVDIFFCVEQETGEGRHNRWERWWWWCDDDDHYPHCGIYTCLFVCSYIWICVCIYKYIFYCVHVFYLEGVYLFCLRGAAALCWLCTHIDVRISVHVLYCLYVWSILRVILVAANNIWFNLTKINSYTKCTTHMLFARSEQQNITTTITNKHSTSRWHVVKWQMNVHHTKRQQQ